MLSRTVPVTPSVDGTNLKTLTVVIPAWAGSIWRQYRKIPGLDKSILGLGWNLGRHDGYSARLAVFFIVVIFVGSVLISIAFPPAAAILPVVFPIFARGLRYLLRDRRPFDSNKPFTLYLRPFSSDPTVLNWEGPSRYKDMPLTQAFGPNVRAVGSPRDMFPSNIGFNVSLIHASNESWQAAVTESIERAKFIWIQCGLQQWVQWEIRRVLELRTLSSIAFVLPTNDKQQVWDLIVSYTPENTPDIERLRQLDVTHLMIVCFKSPDTLVLVRGERDSQSEYLAAVYAARSVMLGLV